MRLKVSVADIIHPLSFNRNYYKIHVISFMPMYDYQCAHCGHLFEELVFSSSIADTKIICPECNKQEAKRQLSAPAVAVGGGSFEAACEKPGCSTPAGFT